MKGNILIVEANAGSLRLLEEILEADGFEVRPAVTRKSALESIAERLPDLMLMDITMPDMDVIEVCRRLKGNPSTNSIPVIFLGDEDETDSRVRAFEAGGVDFITRPFVREELVARVKNHCRFHAAHRELLATNLELSREIDARRMAEEVSLESNYRLFQIMQMISVPTFVIDRDHSVTHWNNAMERLTGLAAVEMIGTREQWRCFHNAENATLADIIVDGGATEALAGSYGDRFQQSPLIEGAYEVEEFYPCSEVPGKWYYITAAPLVDSYGRLIGAIETVQDITERKRAEMELKEREQKYRELSITDSLTKLHNSRHFFRQLVYEVNRAKRYNKPLSLMLMDIDDFKRYNDTYGHPEGDQVLKTLSATIKNDLRDSDTAFRYGGEEFTVILPETSGENACLIAERLRKNFEDETLSPLPGSEVHMTVSIGVSRYLPDESAEAFLKRADEGMYRAKKEGKNRVFFAPPPEQEFNAPPNARVKRSKPGLTRRRSG